MEKESPIRFQKNVAGDFYTTGECMAYDAPESEAVICLHHWTATTATLTLLDNPKPLRKSKRLALRLRFAVLPRFAMAELTQI